MNLEQYLQKHFNSNLKIMEYPQNPDIDVLYIGRKRLCSIPKGLKKTHFFTDLLSDKRNALGYTTSDSIQHRSWNGIGLILLHAKIITSKQFVNHFVSQEQRKYFMDLVRHERGNIADMSYHYRKLNRDIDEEKEKHEMIKRKREAKKRQYKISMELQKIIKHKKIAA